MAEKQEKQKEAPPKPGKLKTALGSFLQKVGEAIGQAKFGQ